MKHLKLFIFLCILTFAVSCGQQKRYVQYKVQEGETMSVIAKKLKMTTYDLLRLNPDKTENPKTNSFIVVPEKKLTVYQGEEVEQNEEKNSSDKEGTSTNTKPIDNDKTIKELDKEFEIHEVKKGETFYSLSKLYNVSRAELLLLNPELIEGLKVGQILKVREVIEEVKLEDVYYDDYIERNTALKVALLLPFKAGDTKYDTLKPKEIFSNQGSLENIVTDFYLGAEIAVDSLRKKGVNIEFNVHDTGDRRTNGLGKLVSNNSLNRNNVIIGPLYSEELEMLSRNVNVPVVFPVYSKNQSQFSSSNIIKTSPEKEIFRKELEDYIGNNFTEGNIVIIADGKSESLQTSRTIKSSLDSKILAGVVSILSPIDGYIKKNRLMDLLKPNTKNWVILATTNRVILSDAINSLISLPKETAVTLFTFGKDEVFDNINNQKLAKLNFTYVSDEFVDEESLSAKTFDSQYVARNKTLPSYYAIKGFDVTYDILIRLASGKDLKSTFMNGSSFRVESKFNYRTNSYGVAENEGLFILQYNKDLSLTRLK